MPCSICKKQGHNIRTCKMMKEDAFTNMQKPKDEIELSDSEPDSEPDSENESDDEIQIKDNGLLDDFSKLNLEENQLNDEKNELIKKLSIVNKKLSIVNKNLSMLKAQKHIKNNNKKLSQINKDNINVNDIFGFTKIGIFELNNRRSKSLWNFKKYNNIKNEKGSHIYIIAVNDIIKKIGASANKKGITNVAGYVVGNSGEPSDRNTGIHYYIGKELLNRNEVTFWIKMCSTSIVELYDLFGNVENENCSIDPKIQEDKYINSYYKLCGKFPEWNMQEQGRNADWEESIKYINRSLKSDNILEYNKNEDYDDLMKLYHWKYNEIPFSS